MRVCVCVYFKIRHHLDDPRSTSLIIDIAIAIDIDIDIQIYIYIDIYRCYHFTGERRNHIIISIEVEKAIDKIPHPFLN